MKKETNLTNFRVTVCPKIPDLGFDDEQKKDVCRLLLQRIKEQTNLNVASAKIEYDKDYVCSFCGTPWISKSPIHNDGCCKRDKQAMLNHHKNLLFEDEK
jgi:rubrerythrin